MRRFPSEHIASGWYQVGWSWEFPAGKIVSLSYFDRELVAYRGTSGEVRVMDAYCKHMGAHFGAGGCVEGDSIRCPYHGWLYDSDGRNIEIPYSSPDKMGRVRMRTYPVREIDGTVLTYYHPDPDVPPTYELPEQWVRFDGEAWEASPEATHSWFNEPISPQFMAENAADAAHFRYVHRSTEVADIGDFTVENGVFKARINLHYGGHAEKTWATPNGPVDGLIHTENWGVGIGWSRLQAFDDVIYVLGITPITARTADLRSTTWVAKKRADGSQLEERLRNKWVKQQNLQVDADMVIWRTMSYIAAAPWAKSEQEPMRILRDWAKQFYPADGTTPELSQGE
ncbi:MAG TPA: Rieske 2Fe-2S domain-containing protein [Sporichthya sp.]|nr:Rieske 2Fe-2S domain-containing protein [Sporichthya sp.]